MKANNRSIHTVPHRSRQRGFTLIELMIVVAVLGIIIAYAIPSYTQYKQKARRNDAKTLLMQLVSKQEQFFQDNRSYSNDFTKLGTTATLKATTVNKGSVTTDYYTVTMVIGAGQPTPAGMIYNYTVVATPVGAQASDICNPLAIDQDGTKGANNTNPLDLTTPSVVALIKQCWN